MARGVGWDDRKDGWWLASNGRWYEPRYLPKSWNRTALPPAPHDPTALNRQPAAVVPPTSPAGPESARPSEPANVGRPTGDSDSRITRTRRPAPPGRYADAEVIDQRPYRPRIDAADEPAGALPAAQVPDAAEDRRSASEGNAPDVHEPPSPQPTSPPPPSTASSNPPAPKRPRPVAAPPSGAQDFGRMLGQAKKRLDQAINDAAKSG